MANEITTNLSLAFVYGDTNELLQIVAKMANSSGLKYQKGRQSIGTSEEAIGLGEVTTPGWFVGINRDETNFINLKVATSGAIFGKLLPGEACCVRLGSGAQAPFAIADTLACILEYLVIST